MLSRKQRICFSLTMFFAPLLLVSFRAGTESQAYVTNERDPVLTVIDTISNAVVATVPIAKAPSAVAVTPDGTDVYVLGSSGVLQVIDTSLIDGSSDPVVATFSLGRPGDPQQSMSIAILPDGTRAFAVVSGTLWVIDTTSRRVLTSLYVGTSPHQLAVSPDGRRPYVPHSFGHDAGFSFDAPVVVVDTETDSVLDVVPLFNLPVSIALSPDGERAYVAIVYRYGDSSHGSGFVKDRYVAVIDLVDNAVTRWIRVPDSPGGGAATPDASSLYVAVHGIDPISVIDGAAASRSGR